mgnify:CR=1 FL=1|tara:strand:- start:330 stop:584 length:255 start_codon:yes stop_codon:yes gene_type:complete
MAKKKKITRRSYAPRSSKANTQVSALLEPMVSRIAQRNPNIPIEFIWAMVSALKIGGAVGTGASSIWAGKTIEERLLRNLTGGN